MKNYAGTIYGKTDDYTWIKCKTDPYGNTFTKTVRNPIKQVNRQVYLLARHLEEYGFYVWVEGYAFVLFKEIVLSGAKKFSSVPTVLIRRYIHLVKID